ncbi:Filament-like plant protein 4 [Camellia lanceoleosa]|uniref:Filament-like plant protein 4 n=1 Tax=Camellia lanceoleosa TaxID=1840588 RepID=A0ACC0HSK2_9ERIC|nr:Filament-like plant protein 4 [Camellia lanceoleosa]
MRISMLFESKDADMKKILDDVRCVVQETQDSLHHHTMGCVFMESHCSDATCDRQACFEGTEVIEEEEMSLSKDSSINEELVAAVSWIHDFVLVLGNEATAIQGTSPDGDVLSQKIQKFSAAFDKVINSKISMLDFVLDLSCVLIKASELHFNVLGYKSNEAETNCSYCIDKVALPETLPENKVVRDTSGDRYSNGCACFSGSTSDPDIPHEGSFMVLDLESTKAQLQGTEQLLAEVKSQLASAQKLNSLVETQLKCMAESYKSLETRAEELQTEVNILRAKTENLDNKLQEERRNHQDALAKFKDF